MNTQTGKRTKRNIVIFTLAVLGLAVLAWIIEPFTVPPDAEPGTAGLGQLLWIVSPVLVMVLLRSFGGNCWSDFGLGPNFKGNGFWWWTSILYYPIIILVILLLGTLTGGLTIRTEQLSGAVPVLVTLLVSSLVKNIFEEFAWRGYLAPKVYSLKKNIWLSHAFVGLIWGLWHVPFVMALWPYLTPDMLPIFIPLLLLGCMSDSIVYGEIRLATNSVLPAWISHTVGNVVGNFLILNSVISLRSGQELFFTPGGEGIISTVLMLALGIWLHQRRTRTA
jgi:membrane protease YdiL (CAAX protease family)